MSLEIPLQALPAPQLFEIDLDGESVELTVKWNAAIEQWILKIRGLSFDLELSGLSLLVGFDLLGPHAVLEIGELWVIDAEDQEADPDFDGLGTRFILMYRELVEI